MCAAVPLFVTFWYLSKDFMTVLLICDLLPILKATQKNLGPPRISNFNLTQCLITFHVF